MISKQLLLQLFRSYFILFPNFLDSGGCEEEEEENDDEEEEEEEEEEGV